jgi:ABC-2 type transport system ATP-binding protein
MRTRVIQQPIEQPQESGVRPTVLEFAAVTKDYGPLRAVDGLSFSVRQGRITGFLGPNGSGKTTSLRMLVGLADPSAGAATIDGRPYRELDRPQRQVGVMLEAATHPSRSARDHLRVLAVEAGVPRSRVEEVLELVELTTSGDRRVGTFSLGMHQRLGLAGALIGDPPILILDEPANGLDPEGIRWLRELLRSFAADGRTVLLSSHVLGEVAATVDDVVVISEGRLVADAPLSELLARHTEDHVRVRTSDASTLTVALGGPGVTISSDGADALTISGVSQEVVARTAHDHGIVLHELTTDRTSLEDLFFALTAPNTPGGVA